MILNNKTCIVFDIESLVNCFTCSILNTETNEIKTFEVSSRKNEISEIITFFIKKENVYFIGYNNIHYDSPIINYCIDYFDSNMPYDVITKSINNLSNVIISNENPKSWSKWKYSNYFHQIDLLTMHFSSALRVSLKELQVTMMYKNVQEMHIDWTKPIEESKIDELISYNINDIQSTAELLKTAENALKMRLDIQSVYGINVLSKDGMKIGISVLESKYLESTGLSRNELYSLKTKRDFIDLKDCILPFIKFNNSSLSTLLNNLKNTRLYGTKQVSEHVVFYAGHSYTVASGGLHSNDKPGIIKPKENELLIDADVGSFFISLNLITGNCRQ